MKIGFFVYGIFMHKGGTERITVQLANSMRQRGHDPVIFGQTPADGRLMPSYPVADGVVCSGINLTPGAGLKAAKEIIIKHEPDVFCAVYAGDPLLWIIHLLRETGIPLLVSEHSCPAMMDIERWNRYERLGCMAGADGIHVLSDAYAGSLPPGLRTKTTVIPNPVEKPCEVDWTREQAQRKILLSVGRLNEQDKQYSMLLQAFALLAGRFKDWDLHICGGGEQAAEYRRLIHMLKLEDRIYLHGRVDDVDRYYARAHVFCLPSRHEGFPLVVLEAQRHALPIIGFSSCSGLNEIVAHGENGLLVPDMAHESLAANLSVLMSKAGLRKRLGESGQTMLVRYAQETIFAQWEALLIKTAESKNKTRLQIAAQKEDEKARVALMEILNRPHPFYRPDHVRIQGKINEANTFLRHSVAALRLKEKSMEEIGLELASDLQRFEYPLPADDPNKGNGIQSITYLIPSLGPGGAERQLATLAKEINSKGIRTSIICFPLTDEGKHYNYLIKDSSISFFEIDSQKYVENGRKVLELRSNFLNPLWIKTIENNSKMLSLLGLLDLCNSTVLHCYLDDANCLGGLAGLVAGIPKVILSLRSMAPDKTEHLSHLVGWSKVIYTFLARSQNIHFEANSSAGARDYAEWLNIDLEKINVTFNGIDSEYFSLCSEEEKIEAKISLGLPHQTPTVSWVGRFVSTKNPMAMLHVVKLVREVVSDVRFLIVGAHKDQTNKMTGYIERNKIKSNIVLFQDVADIKRIYHASDVLLSTSVLEGFPNNIAEAMLCGIPVVATAVGAVPDLIPTKKNGFIHDPKDIDGMAGSIIRLILNASLGREIGMRSRERILKNYTPKALCEYEMQFYSS